MKAYEKMGFGENLSWCRPYESEDERVYAVFCDGEIISLMIDGVEYHKDFARKVSLMPKIAEAARIVNEYSDMYTDILDAFWDGAIREVGCADCPWRDECDCMDLDEEEE